MTKMKLLSIALVTLVALTIISGEGVVKAQTEPYSFTLNGPSRVPENVGVPVRGIFTVNGEPQQDKPIYIWDAKLTPSVQLGGPTSTDQNGAYSIVTNQLSTGEYVLVATVGSAPPESNEIRSDPLVVQVIPSFTPPSITSATATPSSVQIGKSVTFNVTVNNPSGAQLLRYTWIVTPSTPQPVVDATGNASWTPIAAGAYQASVAIDWQAPGQSGITKSDPIDVTVGKAETTTTLGTSSTTPAAGQPVTFTATVRSGTAPLSGKSVTIYHITDGVRINDVTTTTSTNGVVTYVNSTLVPGQQSPYYAEFVGDNVYKASTSAVVTITVGKQSTTLTITASTSTPTTNVPFTLMSTLKAGTTGLAIQSVHLERRTYSGGSWSAWADVVGTSKNTDANGKVSVSQTVSTAGTYQYRWHFSETARYKPAYSLALTETVKKSATFSISSSTSTPTTNAMFTLSGALKSGTAALTAQPVHLERRVGTTGTWANVAGTYKFTNTTGFIKLAQTVSTAGQYQYRWHYNGTATYASAYSPTLTETVKKPTALTIVNSTAPKYNIGFTLSGTVKSGTTGLPGLSVHLERKVGTGAWADVSDTTKATTTGGTIPRVYQTMYTHGTYSYRWHFTGTGTYQAGYSPVKTFTV